MIKPGRKPRRYDAPIEKAVQRPAGTLISREDALAIALEDAPPAMRVVAVPRIYQGVQVFSVTFHTENGSVERVVDRVTGEILP